MATIGTTLAVPAGDGVGAASSTANMSGPKSVLVSGNFAGVLILEAAAVAGGAFCQVASFTGPKNTQLVLACEEMRVRSVGVSGAPVVDVSAEEGVTSSVALAVPAGDGAGAASDITALGELTTAIVGSFGGGVLSIEISEDGVNWIPGFPSFTLNGGCRTRVVPANFARVVRSGGSVGAPAVELAAIADAGGGIALAEPRTCFVFRPGDPLGPHENVYTDFAALMAAVNSVEGCKTILFDDSSLSPCVIPAGAWDFTDVTLDGIEVGTPVNVADGAVITSQRSAPMFIVKRITMTNLATAAPISMPDGDQLVLEENAVIQSNGGAGIPLIALAGDGGIALGNACRILDAGQPVISVLVNQTLSLLFEGADGALAASTLTGAGDAIAQAADSSSIINSTQAGLAGGLTVDLTTIVRDRYAVPATGTVAGVHGGFHRVDATAGDVSINLPPSSPGTIGQSVVGKKIDGGANNVIMNPAGADTIVGTDRSATAQGAIKVVDMGDGTWATESVL